MRADLLLLAADLARRGECFALATVVHRTPPSSARLGDAALITRAGTFHGWLGGSCTQPTVVREAMRAMVEGTPRLISLSPDSESEGRDGVTVFPMTCHSGGSVDIYIEPQLPAPRLVVFGVSPVAQAVARLAKVIGFPVDAVDSEADRATFPEADRIFTSLESLQLRPWPGAPTVRLFVVVATMGQGDEEALSAALGLDPVYVGVVASRRRFSELRAGLLARGRAPEAIERVKGPAGLDIGARTPEEIAVSILAEIVQVVRAVEVPVPAVAAAMESEEHDPVCGMSVARATSAHQAEFGGRRYYFCCDACRQAFRDAPERYATPTQTEGAA